ncbi:MAG: MurT ligase domain-containing protein [Actinomycetes bacterium]
MVNRRVGIAVSRSVKRLAALHGGGSALPGLVIEALDRTFVRDSLQQLPRGVVVISGTNGKTTTTKVVAELLTGCGLRVFTNRTGSNMTRGIAAALLDAVSKDGTMDHDIAVLELDEGYAARFSGQVQPRYSLILNVMRDQLDRFGEIDRTASLLATLARNTTDGVVLNRDDPRVAAIAQTLPPGLAVHHFGTGPSLRSVFVSDDELHGPWGGAAEARTSTSEPGDVELSSYDGSAATFSIDGEQYEVGLRLRGVYNFLNAASALALCKMVLGGRASNDDLLARLESVAPAFGRGETLTVNGVAVELVLVKNPSGFRLALLSFDPANVDVMIAINDGLADGRDVSWLWDVDFTSLRTRGVLSVTGSRAYDMALRLQYDDVRTGSVEPDLDEAVRHLVTRPEPAPVRIFCTYTAMLVIRRSLARFTKVERALR